MKRPGLVILMIVTAFAYYQWYYLPEANALGRTAAETEQMRGELLALRSSIASTKPAAAANANSMLPEARHPSFILAGLSAAAGPARAGSLALASVSTTGTRMIGGQTCEDMDLSGRGRFDEVIAFFERLEGIRPRLGVRSWSLATDAKTGVASYHAQISYIKSATARPGDLQLAALDTAPPAALAPIAAKPEAPAAPAKPLVVDALPGSGARIEGVLSNESGRVAMIAGRLVRPGAVVDGMKFIGVDAEAARFRARDGRMILVAWSR